MVAVTMYVYMYGVRYMYYYGVAQPQVETSDSKDNMYMYVRVCAS